MDEFFHGLINLLVTYRDAANWRLVLGLAVTMALFFGIIFNLDNEATRWSLGVAVLIIGATLSHVWQRSCDPQD